MQNAFLDYLELSLTAEQIRELRAYQLELGDGSMAGIRTAINRAKRAGDISTASLIEIAETVGGIDDIFDAGSVSQLNIKKGLRTWTDAFGIVHYDQDGFNPSPDEPRLQQAQFNDEAIAKRRLREMGGTTERVDGSDKSAQEIFQEVINLDQERVTETQALFDVIQPIDRASEPSGTIAVDSSWINTIERNGDGTTTIQTYSPKGTRLYSYPDASSNIFDAMNQAHRGGTSVGRAWHQEVKDTGLSEIFT
ncbi:hypothetical protein [Vibrio astriarenae]|uniref:hypothetical protein n=1 Tax=Vibrio astriarenae TaxID=1481923 RepID=UPI0037358DCB